MKQHGVIKGYAVAGSDYLPGAFTILAAVDRFGAKFNLDVTLVLKMTIAAFAAVSTAIFWWWSRNRIQATFFFSAILLNSAALGYLDAFYLPPLLLMFWSLQQDKRFLAGLCLGTALCFKWQPLLVVPFVFVVMVGIPRRAWLDVEGWKRASGLLLGAILPLLLEASIFGPHPIIHSFKEATSHRALSYQGLNINWALQMWLHSSQRLSGPFFELQPGPSLILLVKGAFFLAYVSTLITLWLRGRTYEDLIWCAFMGAFCYFSLNTGVHENHLFIIMIMAFCLFTAHSKHAFIVSIYCTLSANLNLIIFYGLQGRSPIYSSFTNSASALFSLLNFSFFVLCFVETLRFFKRPPLAAAPAQHTP